MADRILALLEDRGKASEMGRRASAHVRAQYNMPLTVARYHQVYRALLDPGSATLSRVSMAAPLFASTPGEMAERPWG